MRARDVRVYAGPDNVASVGVSGPEVEGGSIEVIFLMLGSVRTRLFSYGLAGVDRVCFGCEDF